MADLTRWVQVDPCGAWHIAIGADPVGIKWTRCGMLYLAAHDDSTEPDDTKCGGCVALHATDNGESLQLPIDGMRELAGLFEGES